MSSSSSSSSSSVCIFDGLFSHSLFGLLTSHLDHASQLVFCRASSAYFRYWRTVYVHNQCNNHAHPEEKYVLMLQLIALNEWKIVYHVILGGSFLDLSFQIDTPLYTGKENEHILIHEGDFPFEHNILDNFARFDQLCKGAGFSQIQMRLSWAALCDYVNSKHQLVSDTLAAPFIHAGYAYPLSSKRGFWTRKGHDLLNRRFPHLSTALCGFPSTSNNFEAFCIANGALKSLHVFSPVRFCSEDNVGTTLLAHNTDSDAPGWLSTVCTSFYYDVITTVAGLRSHGKEFYTEALKLILPRFTNPFLHFDACSRLNCMVDGEILTQRGAHLLRNNSETSSHFFGLFLEAHLVCRRSSKCDPIYCADDEPNALVVNWISQQIGLSSNKPETFHVHLMEVIFRMLEFRCTTECFIEAFKIVQPLLRICTEKVHNDRIIKCHDNLHETIVTKVIHVIERLEPEIFSMANPLDAQTYRDIGLSRFFATGQYHERFLVCAENFKNEPAGLNYFMVIWHIALKYYISPSIVTSGGLAMQICKTLFYDVGKSWIDFKAMNDLFPYWQQNWIDGYTNLSSYVFADYLQWCLRQYTHMCKKRKHEISNC